MADDLLRSRRWALRSDPRASVRTAVVWTTLDALAADRVQATGRSVLDVVDLGGGTGGFAVPLAELGHQVTVVDPSPDALAALQRRAAEAGVAARVRALQGDAATSADVVPMGSADLVLCHGVLEHVDDPVAAAGAALGALRPGGLLSLLVDQRLGAVLARAISGRFADALRLLEQVGPDPAGAPAGGRAAGHGRYFDTESLLALLGNTGYTVHAVHGVRLVTDLLPGALVDGEPESAEALLALERAASQDRRLVALAAQLHVVVQADGN